MNDYVKKKYIRGHLNLYDYIYAGNMQGTLAATAETPNESVSHTRQTPSCIPLEGTLCIQCCVKVKCCCSYYSRT